MRRAAGALGILLPTVAMPVLVAAWLSMRNNALGGHRPIDELRTADPAPVIALAQQAAEGIRGWRQEDGRRGRHRP